MAAISSSIEDYPFASARSYFEHDTEWAENKVVPQILAAYNHAARRAASAARVSLFSESESREVAVKWEAVATTLEGVLALFDHTDDCCQYGRDDAFDFERVGQ